MADGQANYLQIVSLLVPASTFVVIMNARIIRIADIIRKNAEKIENPPPDVRMGTERVGNLIYQIKTHKIRYVLGLIGMLSFVAGILVLGVLGVVVPAFSPPENPQSSGQVTLSIAGVVMAVGLVSSFVELALSGLALFSEADHAKTLSIKNRKLYLKNDEMDPALSVPPAAPSLETTKAPSQ